MQSTEPLRGGEDVVRWYAAGIATCHLHRSALGPASSREGGGVADRHSTPSPQSLGGLAVVVTYSPNHFGVRTRTTSSLCLKISAKAPPKSQRVL
jgi:hypothetical protein